MSFPRSVFVSSWFTVMTAGEVGYREVGKTCSTRALELWETVRLQRGTCRRGVQGSQRWVRVHTCFGVRFNRKQRNHNRALARVPSHDGRIAKHQQHENLEQTRSACLERERSEIKLLSYVRYILGNNDL